MSGGMASRENVGSGWWPIIDRLEQELRDEGVEWTVEQIKEKFGGLRYYLDGDFGDHHEAVHRIVNRAAEASVHTCEECGQPGTTVSIRSWLYTLCPAHQAVRRAEREGSSQ